MPFWHIRRLTNCSTCMFGCEARSFPDGPQWDYQENDVLCAKGVMILDTGHPLMDIKVCRLSSSKICCTLKYFIPDVLRCEGVDILDLGATKLQIQAKLNTCNKVYWYKIRFIIVLHVFWQGDCYSFKY